MEPKKRWSDLTPPQRVGVIAAAAVEVLVTATALLDLARRPRALVRGPKLLWFLGCFVQPIGPMAYMKVGRRTA
jgi:hypothetical protein